MQEMEHYASDLLLSQEGYHSIDFTLLDRPSGSIASAPESTASLLPDVHPGEDSFPSFDFSDGAGVESFDDATLRNIESFRRGFSKRPDTRSRIENSVQSNSSMMYGQGVHDFFEQDNQQPSDLGNWSWDGKRDSNDQPQLPSSGTYCAEGESGINFLLNVDRYGANARMNFSGCASSSEMATTDLGASSMHSFLPIADDCTNNLQSSQVKFGLTIPQEITGSTVIRSQPRNQPTNVEALWNFPQNSQFKPSHPAILGNSSFTNNINSHNVGGLPAQVQNHNGRLLGQNFEGGASVEPPAFGFLGSQLLLKGQVQGALGHGQTTLGQGVAFGQQTGSSGRPVGLTDGQVLQQQSLLSQHQLQEMHRQLVLQQLKQHSEQVRQQQMQQQAYTQFQGISYSALLQGNDSPSPSPVPSPQTQPPPQPQPQPQIQSQLLHPTGGLPMHGLENHGATLLAANFTNASTGGLGWPVNSSSHYQGLTSDVLMGQDPNLAWQLMALKGFQADPSTQRGSARDGNGHVLAFYPGMQNAVSDYGGSSRIPSNLQVGKPVPLPPTSGTALVPEVQTDSFAIYNGLNNDLKQTQQVQLKQFSGQHLQRPDMESIEQNQIGNGLHFVNMLSKSHAQDFQAGEQRNWDISERKWNSHFREFSQPLKSPEFLPASTPNTLENSVQNSSVHSLSNFDHKSRLAGTGQFLQQRSCQSGSPNPECIVDFKQQQHWNIPGTGTSINSRDGATVRQNMDTWGSLQAHELNSDSGTHVQLLPNANQNIWGGTFPHKGNSLIGNSFHSTDSLKSRQLAFRSVQSPQQGTNKNGRESSSTTADMNLQFNQKRSYSYDLRSSQESGWKENNRMAQTIHTVPSLLEPDGHSQGSWKNHTSPIQSPDQSDNTHQVADGDGHSSRWICDLQPGIVETEAPYRMKLAPRKPNLANRQESQAVQHANERLFSGGDIGPQQNQSQDIPNYVGNQRAGNVISVVSDQDGKLVCNLTKDTGTPFHEMRGGSEVKNTRGGADVDLGIARNSFLPNKYFTLGKNSSIEKQKEISQSADASASISLAHFRRNQSSSSLSPQNIKLGLGPPSHMSQILQQGGNVHLSKFGHVQGSVTADIQTHPCNSGDGSQIVGGDKGDVGQVSNIVLGGHSRVSENFGELSSVQASNIPSSISNENMQSEPLLPSNTISKRRFQMANEEARIEPPSQRMISFESTHGASGLSQTEWNLDKNFDSNASQAWPHVGNCGFTQDFPSAHHTTQSSSTHGNPSHPTYIGSSMPTIQERHMINTVMQQSGERDHGDDTSGLLATSKASLPGQSKFFDGQETNFQGVLQSLQLPSRGVQEDQAPTLQEAQMNADKSMTSRSSCVEDLRMGPMTRAGSRDLLDECSDPFKAHQEKAFKVFEASGLQKRPSLGQVPEALLNGCRPNAGGLGQNLGVQKQSKFILPAGVSPQLGTLDNISPAYLSQAQSFQQQTDASCEGLSLCQMSEGLPHSDAQAEPFCEPAVKVGERLNEGIKKPLKKQLKSGILGGSKANMKGSINQQVSHSRTASRQSKGLLDLRTMPHQTVFSSNVSIQRSQAAVDDSSLVPSHAAGNLVVGVSSNNCMGQNMNSTHTNVELSCPSVPQLGSSTSDRSLPSQASIYHNLSAGGRALALSQQLLSKSPGQAVLFGGQTSHTPVGVAEPVLKEGESRFFVKSSSAVLDQISHNHFSPLKSNLTFHPKKRKKQVPPLIPWHVAATQPRNHLVSAREAELRWANAMNRLPEKDDGECNDEGMPSVVRAKRRLRSTTQLMQQLIPPLSGALMHGNLAEDNECATYTLAKLALGDACRLVAGTRREAVPVQIGVDNKNMSPCDQGVSRNMAKEAAMSRIVESFMLNAKRLDNELARLDSPTSALELTCEANDSEKLSIVNRLARHYGTEFSLDSSDNVYLENVNDIGTGTRRPLPQKYVTAVPMPRTLPEGVKCLSL